MAQKKKQKKYYAAPKKSNAGKGLFIFALAALVGAAGVGGYLIAEKTYKPETPETPSTITPSTTPDSVETTIQNNGIQLKLLNTTENEDGSVTKTLSYSVEPENATFKNLNTQITWIDGKTEVDGKKVSDYVDCSVDPVAQIISVTVKRDFGTQILITFESVALSNESSVSATLTLDYVRKAIDIDLIDDSLIVYNSATQDYASFIENWDDVEINYSYYTKLESEKYYLKFIDIKSTANITSNFPTDEIAEKIMNVVCESFINSSDITAEKIMNALTQEERDVYLNNLYLNDGNDTSCSQIDFNAEVVLGIYQNENLILSRTFGDSTIEIDCFEELDYSAYVINPTEITLESTTLEF